MGGGGETSALHSWGFITIIKIINSNNGALHVTVFTLIYFTQLEELWIITLYYLVYCWGKGDSAILFVCLFFAVSKEAENVVCNNWVCKSLQLQPCSTYYQHMITKTCAQSLLNKVAALHQGCTLFARQSRSANTFLNLEKVHSPSWVHCSKPQSCCGLRVKKIMEFTECWRELFNFRKKKNQTHTREHSRD